MTAEKYQPTQIEKQFVNIALTGGLIIMIAGIFMSFMNLSDSSFSFETELGIPFSNTSHHKTINGTATIAIGAIIFVIGIFFKRGINKNGN